MRRFQNEKFPETLDQLIALVNSNTNITSPISYRVNCVEYNYPPFPEFTYSDEGKTRDQIHRLMFPRAYSVNKKTTRKSPVKRYVKSSHEEPVKVIEDAVYIIDDQGVRTKKSLLSKLKKCNIYTKKVYDSYKIMFKDWPSDPKTHYNNWVLW